jgi:hypothetical protein
MLIAGLEIQVPTAAVRDQLEALLNSAVDNPPITSLSFDADVK